MPKPSETNLFNELVRDVPDGMWAAISKDEKRLVAQGYTVDDAQRKAKEAGENEPHLFRVRHLGRRGISVVR
jgi:hypothetical protein